MLNSFLHGEINAKKSEIKASVWQSKGKIWWGERLKVGGEGDDRGQDGRMASLAQWIWAWASSSRWGRAGGLALLQSMGLKGQTWWSNWTRTGGEDLPASWDLTDITASTTGLAEEFFLFTFFPFSKVKSKQKEHWVAVRNDAYKLRCWRHLRVPWIAGISATQMLRKPALKDWSWSWSQNTLAADVKSRLITKDSVAAKVWGHSEKRVTEDEMVGWHYDSMDVTLSKLFNVVKGKEAWRVGEGNLKSTGSRRVRRDLGIEQQQ